MRPAGRPRPPLDLLPPDHAQHASDNSKQDRIAGTRCLGAGPNFR